MNSLKGKFCFLSIIIFILLIFFVPALGFAQEASDVKILTVEEAVNYALENSRTLKSAEIDLELKKRAKDMRWNVLIPTVNATGTFALSNEVNTATTEAIGGMFKGLGGKLASKPTYTDIGQVFSGYGDVLMNTEPSNDAKLSMVAGVTAQLNLSLALIEGIKATKANYEAGLISYEQSRKETERNIRKMFYAILLQQESVHISETALENAKKRAEQSTINFKSGLVPELTMLQAQVAYENQKPSLEKAKQAVSQQLDTFAFLLGMKVGTKLQLSGAIEPKFVELDAKALVDEYLENRFDVKSMRKNIEMMKISLAASNFQTYSPALVLSYGYQPVWSKSSGEWKYAMDNGSFSATLAWNLTNMLPFTSGGQKIKDTKQNIAKLDITLQTVLQNGEMEIYQLVDKLNQSRDAIEVSKRNIVLAEKAYEMTYKAYQSGTQELLDVRDSESQMNQAKLGLMNEKFTYMSNLLDLEYAINTKLK